jgi:hypothetical protein
MLATRAALALALLCTAAGSSSTPDAQRPLDCGWSRSLTLPAYDPADGQPSTVVLVFQRLVIARARIENMTPGPALADAQFAAILRLRTGGGLLLDERSWSGSASTFLGPFDGQRDALGSSGTTILGGDYRADTIAITDPVLIQTFARIGGGTCALQIETLGASGVVAPTGVLSDLDLLAGARVLVTYHP